MRLNIYLLYQNIIYNKMSEDLYKCSKCSEEKKPKVVKPRGPRKVKLTKVVAKEEGDIIRVNLIPQDQYTLGKLIIQTPNGEYDVQKDGVIVKRN